MPKKFLIILSIPLFLSRGLAQDEISREEDSLHKAVLYLINQYRKINHLDTLSMHEPLQFAAALSAEKISSSKKPKTDETQTARFMKKAGLSSRGVQFFGKGRMNSGKKEIPILQIAKSITEKWFSQSKIRIHLLNPKYTLAGIFSEPDSDEKNVFVSVFLAGYDAINEGPQYKNEMKDAYNTRTKKIKAAPANKCKNCEKWKNYDALLNAVKVENGKIYLEYPNQKELRKLFKKSKDGLAADVIQKKQYTEKESPVMDFNLHNKGQATRIVYKDKLFEKNLLLKGKTDKEKRTIKALKTELGEFPKNVSGEYEINLLIFQDGKYCKTIHRGFTDFSNPPIKIPLGPVFMHDSRNVVPAFEPKSETSIITFIIPFEKNKYEYRQEDIQPLLNALNEPDFIIDGAYIYAYSSIEGDSAANAKLQRKRAESVVAALQSMQQKTPIQPYIETRDSWGLFLLENEDGPYAWLVQLGKRKAIEKINSDENLRMELEPILAKERFARVVLDVTYDISGEKEEKFVRVALQRALSENKMKTAYSILEFIGKRMKEKKYNPENVMNWINPEKTEYYPALNNLLCYYYEQTKIADEDMTTSFYKMHQAFPTEPVYHYNYLFCSIQQDSLVHDSKHQQDVQQQIDALYGKMDSSYVNALNLQWQFKIFDALDTMENAEDKIQECLSRIRSVLKINDLSMENARKLAYVYARTGNYFQAALTLQPWIHSPKTPLDYIYSYISYAGRVPEIYYSHSFTAAMNQMLQKDPEKFCTLFGEPYLSFQVLENKEVRKKYLEKCRK